MDAWRYCPAHPWCLLDADGWCRVHHEVRARDILYNLPRSR